jgi:hypothetical protein
MNARRVTGTGFVPGAGSVRFRRSETRSVDSVTDASHPEDRVVRHREFNGWNLPDGHETGHTGRVEP